MAAPPLHGSIEVVDVGFRYSPFAPLVLRKISLRVEPGQKVALVGRTGSGKTTLAMVLLGLFAPSMGEVRFDGMPLADLDLGSLRRQCGIVLQEPFIFNGSVRDNIAFNTDAPLAQVEAAARAACLHDDVMRMPMGYETRVGERGTALSGGQRQRLALARTLLQQPSILLLDEATSHLDAVTEGSIDANLSRLRCTRIVIAHRLSTVRDADVIVVLDNGTIVEQGSHAELLERGGSYARLVLTQTSAR
jgi:ABC-type bacteriocin/lantibiotic exporter with double-glycine peptidase domain